MLRTLFLVLAFATAALPASAQDIFIKPTTQQPQQQNNGGTADLGMKARPTAPATNTPAPAPAPSAATPQPAPPPQTSYPDPGPSAQIETTSTGAQILTLPADNTPPNPGKGGKTLSIALQPGSIGESDRLTISSVLGLTGGDINSNCYFEHMLMMGSTAVDIKKSMQFKFSFNGTIDSVAIYPTIACRKVKPPLSGVVIDQGGYYKLSIQGATCQIGAISNSANLSIRYAGEGTAECKVTN